MLRSQSFSVAAAANAETISATLVTPEGKTRKLRRIDCNAAAGLTLRGYKDQDRVIDENTQVAGFAYEKAPYDIEMPVGVQMRFGFLNTSGGLINSIINVHYDEV